MLESVLGLVIAMVASSKFKGRTLLRVAILVPWAIPTVVSSQVWKWMVNDIYGVVNIVLAGLHLIPQKIAWLATPATAMPVIIAVDVWKATPFMALLLLAGLQLIPKDLYEAGSIDGASKVRQFWAITLPLVTPTLLSRLNLPNPRCVASVRHFLCDGGRAREPRDDGGLQSATADLVSGCGRGFRHLSHHPDHHHAVCHPVYSL